ncbi:hypothetical protein DOY81_009410, partial [Sarcophaga bullata]
QLLTFKDGKVGVNFLGYHAEAGLGGGQDNGGLLGGLHASAGTPWGQNAAAGLGGNVNGRASGLLYAGAQATPDVGASADVLGGDTSQGGFGGSEAYANGKVNSHTRTIVAEIHIKDRTQSMLAVVPKAATLDKETDASTSSLIPTSLSQSQVPALDEAYTQSLNIDVSNDNDNKRNHYQQHQHSHQHQYYSNGSSNINFMPLPSTSSSSSLSPSPPPSPSSTPTIIHSSVSLSHSNENNSNGIIAKGVVKQQQQQAVGSNSNRNCNSATKSALTTRVVANSGTTTKVSANLSSTTEYFTQITVILILYNHTTVPHTLCITIVIHTLPLIPAHTGVLLNRAQYPARRQLIAPPPPPHPADAMIPCSPSKPECKTVNGDDRSGVVTNALQIPIGILQSLQQSLGNFAHH